MASCQTLIAHILGRQVGKLDLKQRTANGLYLNERQNRLDFEERQNWFTKAAKRILNGRLD